MCYLDLHRSRTRSLHLIEEDGLLHVRIVNFIVDFLAHLAKQLLDERLLLLQEGLVFRDERL